MKINFTEVYEAPAMKVLVVELEQGVAAASVAPASATVDDWNGSAGTDGSSGTDF